MVPSTPVASKSKISIMLLCQLHSAHYTVVQIKDFFKITKVATKKNITITITIIQFYIDQQHVLQPLDYPRLELQI